MYEELKVFLEKVEKDEALLARLKECEGTEQIIAFAKELGFAITESDVDALKDAGSRELSDDELEDVNGGLLGLIAAGVTAAIIIAIARK